MHPNLSDTLLALGIDGGATHTRAMLVDERGALAGYGVAGGSNVQSAGREEAARNLAAATRSALGNGDGQAFVARAAFLGMAGVVTHGDRAVVTAMASELELAGIIAVDHDIRTALAGGLAGRPGIALIAGTGSSCYGRTDAGRAWRAGGWGQLLDDAGGGYRLALDGLAAATRAFDGRGEATALLPELMAALGIDDLEELLRLSGTDGLRKDAIAALAPAVLATAAAGDVVAAAIVAHGARELALMVAAVAEHLEMSAPEVIVTGGLTNDVHYRAAVHAAIGSRVPAARICEASLPPVAGAALLALEHAGVTRTDALIENLAHSASTLDAEAPNPGALLR